MVFSPKHNRRRGRAVNTLNNEKQPAATNFTKHTFCQCLALSVKCPGSLTEPWRLAEKPLKILMTAVEVHFWPFQPQRRAIPRRADLRHAAPEGAGFSSYVIR